MLIIAWLLYGLITAAVIFFLFPHPVLGVFVFGFIVGLSTILGGLDYFADTLFGEKQTNSEVTNRL